MDSLYLNLNVTCEEEAINCLRQISNQPQTPLNLDWQPARIRLQQRPPRHRHGVSCDQATLKSSKLPFIPNKQNINENHPFVSGAQRVSSYVLFEKGLGCFGTVQFKKGRKALKNVSDRNKFVKLYSESSDQQVEMIKQWLALKKESCRSYNQIVFKKKLPLPKDQNFLKISIKNIL